MGIKYHEVIKIWGELSTTGKEMFTKLMRKYIVGKEYNKCEKS